MRSRVRVRFRVRRWAVGVAALAAVSAGCIPPPPPPPTVILYGDSLSYQSSAFMGAVIRAQRPGWRVILRNYGGTAICDWFDEMHNDGDKNAKVVVMQFSGNIFTKCVSGMPWGTPTWKGKYRSDAYFAAKLWVGRGAKVLLVGNPLGVCYSPPHPLDSEYAAAAAAFPGRAWFSAAPETALTVTIGPSEGTTAIADAQPPSYAPGQAPEPGVQALSSWPCATPEVATPVFAFEMPCLPDETLAHGCSSGDPTTGTIQVRDGIPGAPGGHFCGVGVPCSGYSSGIRRFGGAIAAEAVKLMY